MATVTKPIKGVLSVRDRILETANDLFYKEGVNAVGIDRILLEAGAAKASLYSHFGSKDELVASYLEHRGAQWRERVTTAMDKLADSAGDRLLLLFDLMAESTCHKEFRGCPFINAAGELSDPSHPAHAVAREHRQWHHNLIRELVEEIGIADVDNITRTIIILFDGAMAVSLVDGNRREASASARWAVVRLLGAST
jgi:AcrR family transcriptional regulator